MKLEDFKGDKRTKEYRAYKQKVKAYNDAQKGLGDVVENITEKTGIKNVVKYLFGEDCGCPERKEWLNKKTKKRVEEFTEQEFYFLQAIFDKQIKEVKRNEIEELRQIWSRVFNKKITSSCLNCSFVPTVYNPLKKLFNLFKQYQ